MDWAFLHGEPITGQQDVSEYWPELYRQLRLQTMDFFQIDLASLFRLFTVTNRVCVGNNACESKWIPTEFSMMHVRFPDRSLLPMGKGVDKGRKADVREAIQQWFDMRNLPVKCDQCHNDRFDNDYLVQIPEFLVVHLNRIEQDPKTCESYKLNTPIKMTDTLEIAGTCFDPRVVDPKESAYYELTSVIMHHGDDVHVGHYYIYAKGPGGKWVCIDDTKVVRYDTFDKWANRSTNQCRAYMFAYRRVTVDPKKQKIILTEGSSDDRVKAVKIQNDKDIQTDDKWEEPIQKAGFLSTFKLKFTPVGGPPVVVNGQIKTSEPMQGIEFPESKGLLELTWLDDKEENILKDLNIQGVLKNVIGRKTGKTTKEPRASRFKEHFSDTSTEAIKSVKSGSGSGSNKSVRFKEATKKPALGEKPTGIVKKRSAAKGALDELKRALGRGDKEEKKKKDKKKDREEKKRREKEEKEEKEEKDEKEEKEREKRKKEKK
ncbi:Peptidase C19 ubiquitin carboxyl-terminal hydrolase 2 [Penicillium sp. IBT 16267x]|nr:Peptidase C19 ubiquitin carboxyl-terminal hydrolase 2 [Penicillium sp. IBT 16267x]